MNKTYFALALRRCIKPWLAITVFLCFFVTVICAAFTPESLASFQGVIGDMTVGKIIKDTTLEGFFANIFFAVIGMVFPMVYTSYAANRLVVKEVDCGAMSCWLSLPEDRITYTLTAAVYLMVSQVLMFAAVFGVGVAAAAWFQPGILDIKLFGILLLGAFLYHFVIGGLCFFSSCYANTSGGYMLLGVVVPLLFIFLNIIRKLVDSLDFLKFATLNTLLNTETILDGGTFWPEFAGFVVLGLALYFFGIRYFHGKDLSV